MGIEISGASYGKILTKLGLPKDDEGKGIKVSDGIGSVRNADINNDGTLSPTEVVDYCSLNGCLGWQDKRVAGFKCFPTGTNDRIFVTLTATSDKEILQVDISDDYKKDSQCYSITIELKKGEVIVAVQGKNDKLDDKAAIQKAIEILQNVIQSNASEPLSTDLAIDLIRSLKAIKTTK